MYSLNIYWIISLWQTLGVQTPHHPDSPFFFFFKSTRTWQSFQFHNQKLFSEVFPTSPSQTVPLGLILKILGFYRPPPHSKWNKMCEKDGNILRGRLLQGHLLLTEVGLGPAIPTAFPSLSILSISATKHEPKLEMRTDYSHRLPCARRGLRTY